MKIGRFQAVNLFELYILNSCRSYRTLQDPRILGN
jgi:hypothetical protein